MTVSGLKKIAGILNLLSALAKILLSGAIYFLSYLWTDFFPKSEFVGFFTDIGFVMSLATFCIGLIVLIGSIGALAGKNWALYLLTIVNGLLTLGICFLMVLGFPFPILYVFGYLLITLYMVMVIYKSKTQYKLSAAQ